MFSLVVLPYEALPTPFHTPSLDPNLHFLPSSAMQALKPTGVLRRVVAAPRALSRAGSRSIHATQRVANTPAAKAEAKVPFAKRLEDLRAQVTIFYN